MDSPHELENVSHIPPNADGAAAYVSTVAAIRWSGIELEVEGRGDENHLDRGQRGRVVVVLDTGRQRFHAIDVVELRESVRELQIQPVVAVGGWRAMEHSFDLVVDPLRVQRLLQCVVGPAYEPQCRARPEESVEARYPRAAGSGRESGADGEDEVVANLGVELFALVEGVVGRIGIAHGTVLVLTMFTDLYRVKVAVRRQHAR